MSITRWCEVKRWRGVDGMTRWELRFHYSYCYHMCPLIYLLIFDLASQYKQVLPIITQGCLLLLNKHLTQSSLKAKENVRSRIQHRSSTWASNLLEQKDYSRFLLMCSSRLDDAGRFQKLFEGKRGSCISWAQSWDTHCHCGCTLYFLDEVYVEAFFSGQRACLATIFCKMPQWQLQIKAGEYNFLFSDWFSGCIINNKHIAAHFFSFNFKSAACSPGCWCCMVLCGHGFMWKQHEMSRTCSIEKW